MEITKINFPMHKLPTGSLKVYFVITIQNVKKNTTLKEIRIFVSTITHLSALMIKGYKICFR